MKKIAVFSMVAAIAAAMTCTGTAAVAQQGSTLATVKARGYLLCGSHPGRYGFAAPDNAGNWVGFESDLCRAVAAAVFGDATKVRFVPLSSQQRFTAIQSGEVDVLPRNNTKTLSRDTSLGLNFTAPTFYTGLGFMVPKSLGVTSIEQLNGASICVSPGSTTEQSVASLFASKGLTYTPVVIENNKEFNDAYVSGRCDAMAKDRDNLPGIRKFDTPNPDEQVILPGTYSKEPLALAVRHGDDQWYDLVSWTFEAMVNAEENGITQANVDEMLKSKDPYIRGMLGEDSDYGNKLGVDNKWAYYIIKQVGSYKDVYDRHFGPNSALPLERDENALHKDGGLLYGLPIR